MIQMNDVCFNHLLTNIVALEDFRLLYSLRRIQILLIVPINANDDSNANSYGVTLRMVVISSAGSKTKLVPKDVSS